MANGSGFISNFFSQLTIIAENFVSFLISLFTRVFALFYDSSAGDGGELTIMGYFLLISIATGFVLWGFNFLRSLIRVRRNG